MANVINARTWVLDTVAGIVATTPVFIESVMVTWKVASAGELVLSEATLEGSAADTIINPTSSGASSAAVNNLTQVIPVNRWVQGLYKVTCTDLAGIEVVTK